MSEQNDSNSPAPAPAIPKTKNFPTVGRVVLCFSANGWSRNKDFREARPGLVSNAFGGPNANVNVHLDGANDADTLDVFRKRPQGNTLSSVPVYDPLTNEQRAEVAKRCSYWCEWMPYQQGQAKRTDAAEGKLLEALKLFLSDPCEAVGKKILKQLES